MDDDARRAVPDDAPWAPARRVETPADCYFYQTVELPEFGLQVGEWDLRGGVDDYLGGVDVGGRRVLELGTANGFLCYEMERRGAEVVAYDLGEGDPWDVVPFGGIVPAGVSEQRRQLARQLHDAWWLTHRLVGSSAQVVYGTVYDVPTAIGRVDVATFGSILLHVRDPFLALERSCALVDDTVIVTDLLPLVRRRSVPGVLQQVRRLGPRFERWADRVLPDIEFLPDPATRQPIDTWWRMSPAVLGRYLGVLGFPRQHVSYHRQRINVPTARDLPMFTLVARR